LPAFGALLVLFAVVSAQQDPDSSDANSGDGDPDRITRLSDSLGNGTDWEIGMPRVDRPMAFEDAVRSGEALDSPTYLELHGDLQDALRATPEASEAALAALRERLRERVESNAALGYIYAAGVYIEMLELAGAPEEEIRALSRRLEQRRAFEADLERFERALDASRLRAPREDSAVYWLEQMRASDGADPERVRLAEERLRAALESNRSERRSP
jgi:hypothetical protein